MVVVTIVLILFSVVGTMLLFPYGLLVSLGSAVALLFVGMRLRRYRILRDFIHYDSDSGTTIETEKVIPSRVAENPTT
jgi:uncharacterized membrane protein